MIKSLKIAVVGHFQVGKSTLVNCLLRKRAAKCGDTTTSTTEKAKKYQCHHLTLIDTPGINAEDAHAAEMEKSVQQADLALLVVTTEKVLSTPLCHMITYIGKQRIPLYGVINCWDDKNWNDGDPTNMNDQLINTIQTQIKECLNPIDMAVVNIEWAAAARGCLENVGRQKMILKEKNSNYLEEASKFQEVEQFLFPENYSLAFSKFGLEYAALVSKFIRRYK